MGNIWPVSDGRLCIGNTTRHFFATIGLSLGFNNPISAQYIGFGLIILTGTLTGNMFGQLALFWRKLIPYDIQRGVSLGATVGVTLIPSTVPIAFGPHPQSPVTKTEV